MICDRCVKEYTGIPTFVIPNVVRNLWGDQQYRLLAMLEMTVIQLHVGWISKAPIHRFIANNLRDRSKQLRYNASSIFFTT